MQGLIIKDFLSLKKMWKNYLFIFAMFIIMATNGSPYFLIATLSIIAFMMPISTYSMDEMCKFNKYASTMPLSKQEIVLSKYLFSIIISAIVWAICLILSLFIKQINLTETIYCLCATTLLGMTYISIFFPLFMKFGIEKARILIFAVIFIPILLSSFLTSHVGTSLPEFFNNIEGYLYFVPLIGLCVMIISYFISVSIMKNKEF